MADIHLGGDAAVVGGVHSDSHDVYNTTTNTTNNVSNIVYQAQRTETEICQDNEIKFLQEVQARLVNGIIDQQTWAELSQLSIKCHIAPERANQIIEQVRHSTKSMSSSSGNDFLINQMLQEIFNAVQNNAVEVISRKLPSLGELAKSTTNNDVQYYYNLLTASLYPEMATMNLISNRADDYWRLYWAHVAYVKLGNLDNATMLLPRLGNFGAPQGDIALIMALDNVAEMMRNGGDYYRTQAKQYLDQAVQCGMSEQLSGLWYAIKYILSDDDIAESWCQFYVDNTLKEFSAAKKQRVAMAKAMQQQQQQMQQMQHMKTAAPPMPEFKPQDVKLQQMQGWNALDAAKQMGLGQQQPFSSSDMMSGMSMGGGMSMGNSMPMSGVPPMPGMQTKNFMTMCGVPSMPSMPMGGTPSMSGMPMNSVPPMSSASAMPNNITESGSAGAIAMQMANEIRQPDDTIDTPDEYEPHYGIILTNSVKLAGKYQCSVEELYKLFNDFMQNTYDQQMYWQFMDLANLPMGNSLGDYDSWLDVNNAISDFIECNDLATGPDLHLFIIGGDDVVPIPEVEDPYEHSSLGTIPTDMCYCYSGDYIPRLIDGENLTLNADSARNNVSRLPLEDGFLRTTPQEDLAAYFNISNLYGGGVPVGNVVMSSNIDWVPASATMSEHLPLLYSVDDPELIKNGMYISPKLLTSDPQSMNIYCSSLKRADMLMFNLHGADAPEMSGFYSKDEAFNPRLLQVSNARVFNTVACFGARYRGYTREQSMLLKSLYGGGVLLYTGSLVPVPMYYDPELNEARELLLNPGTGSEVFMRLYPIYQFKGMTVGKALLRAKCDYFNMCRHIESDGFSLSTALMFCLYGNPMLHIRKRQHVIESALQNDAIPPAPIKVEQKTIARTLKNRVYQRSETSESLLGQLRGYVDQNLEAMRKMVETYLYNQLGLPPRQLDSIDQFSRPTASGEYEMGYTYNYHNDEARYAADTHVEVDMNGNARRVYTIK